MAKCEVRNPSTTTTKKYEETVVDESRIKELLAICEVRYSSTNTKKDEETVED